MRRARIEFGGVEKHREEARTALGLSPFDEIAFSWLDVKLGLLRDFELWRGEAKTLGISVRSARSRAI